MTQCVATDRSGAGREVSAHGWQGDSCFSTQQTSQACWWHTVFADVRLPGIPMGLSTVPTGR